MLVNRHFLSDCDDMLWTTIRAWLTKWSPSEHTEGLCSHPLDYSWSRTLVSTTCLLLTVSWFPLTLSVKAFCISAHKICNLLSETGQTFQYLWKYTTRRPASADRTARRQFQTVFPVMTSSFPTNVIAHLHGLSMDLTVGRTVGPTVDSTVGWTVGLTVKCVNIGLIVEPTIDPTVEITGQPLSRTQASDASGCLPHYEA